jgi:cephalosporin-C deacetylase-like acetyl esterase
MNINTKISKLYNKLDFLQDCDRWVQYRQVYKEITELERKIERQEVLERINYYKSTNK